MELPQTASNGARQRLKDLRDSVLVLHKALLDSERTSYELAHGSITSPGAFLQLLINDAWFAWLQPVTKLIVHIDESLAAKKPPASDRLLEQLIGDTRALLSPSREVSEFWGRYDSVLRRDPAVAVLHDQVQKQLNLSMN